MIYSYDPEQVRLQLVAEGVIDEALAATAGKQDGITDVVLDDEHNNAPPAIANG